MMCLSGLECQNARHARFNRAPEFVTPEFKRKLQEKLKVVVELTPREHHEAVGRSERNRKPHRAA